MEQLIIQIGNSAGVIIPQAMRKQAGIEPGDKVMLENKGNQIVLSKSRMIVDQVVDPEVYKVAKDLMRRYLPAFKELAKK